MNSRFFNNPAGTYYTVHGADHSKDLDPVTGDIYIMAFQQLNDSRFRYFHIPEFTDTGRWNPRRFHHYFK
jgi:hypothetical protein